MICTIEGILQFMSTWAVTGRGARQGRGYSRRLLGTVSMRWMFSRRSFYRGLCGHAAAAVIADCRQPSPPAETPGAPPDPQVKPPQAACCYPVLRPTSLTPASESALCALCSVPKGGCPPPKKGKCLIWNVYEITAYRWGSLMCFHMKTSHLKSLK